MGKPPSTRSATKWSFKEFHNQCSPLQSKQGVDVGIVKKEEADVVSFLKAQGLRNEDLRVSPP